MANWSPSALTAPDVASRLGRWASGPGPLYEQLRSALADLIEQGALPAGARLPPERALGAALHVSRTTVVSAFRRLRSEGYVTSRRGSGTYVERVARQPPRAAAVSVMPATGAAIRTLIGVDPSVVDLTGTALGDEGALTAELLTAGTDELRRQLQGSGYRNPYGLPALREAIASHLAESGTDTRPDQILVTGGGQQALTLLAELFLERGSVAAVQDPTYVGALDVFGRRGTALLGLPVGDASDPATALEELVATRDLRFAYLISTFHNPTGSVLSESQRRDLVAVAGRHRLPLIDDEALADLSLGHTRPSSLAAFDDPDVVLTVGSLSKSCWAGLRIGWIRAHPELIDRLVRLKTVDDLATSLPSQALALAVLGEFERIAAARRLQLEERVELILDRLAAELPEWQVERPAGGSSLWVRLPGADTEQFAQLALRRGVSVLAGSHLSVSRSFDDHVRLQLLQPLPVLEEGVKRLGEAWREYRLEARPAYDDLRVVV